LYPAHFPVRRAEPRVAFRGGTIMQRRRQPRPFALGHKELSDGIPRQDSKMYRLRYRFYLYRGRATVFSWQTVQERT